MSSELWINTANPIAVIICVLVISCIIALSKKYEVITPLIVTIAGIFVILIRHSVYLDGLESSESNLISMVYRCLGIDLLFLLITFIAFLWIDDVVAKKKKIKSYDDSLNWFWNKID